MAKLNLQITPPNNQQVNSVFSELERKYQDYPVTPQNIDNIEREAARLIRRLIVTKVTFVK